MRIRKRRLALGIVLACLAWVALRTWMVLGPHGAVRRITISKETTYITEPLTADGYPDYLAALNRLDSAGVTAENNAAVPLMQAIGPSDIPAESREAYFRLLGIAPLPERGEYFVKLEKFADPRFKPDDLTADPEQVKEGNLRELLRRLNSPETDAAERQIAEDRANQLYRILDQQCLTRPWSRAEFPEIADWLAFNEKPLAKIVEGAEREKWSAPAVGHDAGLRLILRVDAGLVGLGDVTRALCARAMLRCQEGDLESAWRDVRTCLRYARWLGQCRNLLDILGAFVWEQRAAATCANLLHHGRPGSEAIERMCADRRRLPQCLSNIDLIATVERLEILATLAETERDSAKDRRLSARLVHATIDWDEALREVNFWINRRLEVCSMPRGEARSAAVERVNSEALAKREEPTLTAALLAGLIPIPALEKPLGRHIADTMIKMHFHGAEGILQDQSVYVAHVRMTDMAFALAAYRAEHGRYPDDLAALVPKYLSECPLEPFSESTAGWRYRVQGEGYLLYSMGGDGEDNSGDLDDICIRKDQPATDASMGIGGL